MDLLYHREISAVGITGTVPSGGAATSAPGHDRGWAISVLGMDKKLPEIWLEPELPRILIAHPDEDIRRNMVEHLSDYHVREVSDGEEALKLTREEEPDAIIASLEMPGCGGAELCRILRADSVLRWVPVALITPANEQSFEQAIEAGAADVVTMPLSPIELRLRLRNMVRRKVYLRELERKNRVILEALNDLRESEAMLVQAEKLSLLGEMSAGIVHEINNPLNYSKSALYVLQRMVEEMEEGEAREKYDELVSDITDGIERVGHIVRDLRAFAMKGTVQITDVDLFNVVRMSARLFGNKLANINYNENVSEGLLVRGNENNLCQVILNLIKNGVEATEAAGRSLDESEIRVTGEENHEGVVLRVRDNGCGISERARASMFEPFYTTKDRGRGMGLGLSICRRILEDHGATIEVDSEQGKFTEFTLRFPAGMDGEEKPEEESPGIQETMDYLS